jgi:hypothetical protein
MMQSHMQGGNAANFSFGSLAADTAVGAALPVALGKVVPSVMKLLPNAVKGFLGEAFSYVNGIFKGRGFTPRMQEPVELLSGRKPVPDFTYPGQGTRGQPLFVEAKFGRSGLTKAQREASKQFGENWITEKWTYPWMSETAAETGKWLSGANAACQSDK